MSSFIEKGQAWLVDKGPDLLANILIFLVLLIVGAIVIKIMVKGMRIVLKKSGRINETLERFVTNVTSKVLWVILLMIALPRLGIDIAPLIAGLGVTGFIVGFAFQESLGNLAAGLMIILNAPFKVGDLVDVSGNLGNVKEINMMATTLATLDNKKVIIPNSKVWGEPIINYTAYEIRRVDMTAGISYSDDIGKGQAVINQVIESVDLVLKDPAHTVEMVEMADSSVNFVVRPWCKTEDYWTVYFAVMRGIKEEFDKAEIEIPFPQMDVHQKG